MNEIRKQATAAGLLYLAVAIIAPFSLSYVPSQLHAGQGTMIEQLQVHETLLRLSLTSEMVYQVIEVFLTLSLYNLFRTTNPRLSLQMLVLGLLPIPMVFLNQLSEWGALTIAVQEDSLAAMSPHARAGLVDFLHGLHSQGIVIAGIFWGLWLIPLGRLVISSALLPKIFGISVVIGGLGYLLNVVATMTLPSFAHESHIQIISQIAGVMMIGEVPIIPALLWLAFKPSSPASRDGRTLAEVA